MTGLRALAEQWRRDAELLEGYGDSALAKACRKHADDLDAALRVQEEEALDLATAAQESGYSADRLRHKVSAGEIPNAGRKGAPRIRRADLPVKHRASSLGFDPAATAARLFSGRGEQ